MQRVKKIIIAFFIHDSLKLLLLLAFPFYLTACAAKPIGPMIIEGEYVNQGLGAGFPPTTALRSTVIHEVGPGETVWRIGKIYDVSNKNIIRANRLDSRASLEIGQKLKIPNARKGRKAVIPLYESSKWKYIIIHHSATTGGKALTFNNSHLKRGFSHGLGYHFVISNGTQGKADGFIEVSPRWLKQSSGAHCKADKMNYRGIGICLVGNFSKKSEKITGEQLASLAFLVSQLQKQYSIPTHKVLGHGKVNGAQTECPGMYFPWRDFQNRLK